MGERRSEVKMSGRGLKRVEIDGNGIKMSWSEREWVGARFSVTQNSIAL